MKPVCLVIGAGAGIGGTVGRRFAREGHHSASGFLLNAVEAESIEDCVASGEADIGPIEVVVFNLGAQIGDRSLADTPYKAFEMGWRLAPFALFCVASAGRSPITTSASGLSPIPARRQSQIDTS
jgi:NAD(P)-dependent dehydrogenase (short-subunit alcohol dehydrogenase family)